MELAHIGITGEMTFELRGADGKVKQLFNHNALGKFILHNFGIDMKCAGFGSYQDSMIIKNLVTTAGKALASALLGAVGTPAGVTYLEVGIGTTAADAANTALESAIVDSGLARGAAATVSQQTTTTANDTLQLLKSWSVTGTKAVTECGAFNAASAGSMLGRQVFSAINVVNTDTLQITYKFAVA